MRALLSVYDQTGIIDLATGLKEMGCDLISTGGTGQALTDAGLEVEKISDITKFPEILAGRVKSLHPTVYAGILARRDEEDDTSVLAEHGIDLIDIVVVNFYPFLQVMSRSDVSEKELLENIDVGGPALLRAAAKNYHHVVVLSDPEDYEDVLAELLRYQALREKTRRRLAAKAFGLTSAYDAYIASWMSRRGRTDSFLPGLAFHFTRFKTCGMAKTCINRRRSIRIFRPVRKCRIRRPWRSPSDPWKGAVFQQLPGSRCRLDYGSGFCRACRRSRQTYQPDGSGRRSRRARRLQQGIQRRPRGCLRRHCGL